MEWKRVEQLLNGENQQMTQEELQKENLFLRDRLLTIKEFSNLRKQIKEDDNIFDQCLSSLNYHLYPKGSILLYCGQKRTHFEFLIEGSCGVYVQKEEKAISQEIKFSVDFVEQLAIAKNQKLKISEFADKCEETDLAHLQLKSILAKIQQIEGDLGQYRKEAEQNKLKEAILTIDDKKLRTKLLTKHFSQQGNLCLFLKDKALISGDTIEEINLSGKEVKSTIVALEDCHIISISIGDYTRFFQHIVSQIQLSQKILRNYFTGIEEQTIQSLVYEFRTEYYDRNEVIYSQGLANPETLYILLTGSIEIRKYFGKNHFQSISMNNQQPQENQSRTFSVMDNYHSIIIFSNKQVFGTECISKFNQYSAVSISTETKVLALEKKKLEAFDHQFNFKYFLKKQALVQLKFYEERLQQLSEFSLKRQEEIDLSKRIFTMNQSQSIQKVHQSLNNDALGQILSCGSSNKNPQNKKSQLLLQKIFQDRKQQMVQDDSIKKEFIKTEPIDEDSYAQSMMNHKKQLYKEQSQLFQTPLYKSGFNFEEDSEKVRRTNILVEFQVSKQLKGRSPTIDSSQNTSKGRPRHKISFSPSFKLLKKKTEIRYLSQEPKTQINLLKVQKDEETQIRDSIEMNELNANLRIGRQSSVQIYTRKSSNPNFLFSRKSTVLQNLKEKKIYEQFPFLKYPDQLPNNQPSTLMHINITPPDDEAVDFQQESLQIKKCCSPQSQDVAKKPFRNINSCIPITKKESEFQHISAFEDNEGIASPATLDSMNLIGNSPFSRNVLANKPLRRSPSIMNSFANSSNNFAFKEISSPVNSNHFHYLKQSNISSYLGTPKRGILNPNMSQQNSSRQINGSAIQSFGDGNSYFKRDVILSNRKINFKSLVVSIPPSLSSQNNNQVSPQEKNSPSQINIEEKSKYSPPQKAQLESDKDIHSILKRRNIMNKTFLPMCTSQPGEQQDMISKHQSQIEIRIENKKSFCAQSDSNILMTQNISLDLCIQPKKTEKKSSAAIILNSSFMEKEEPSNNSITINSAKCIPNRKSIKSSQNIQSIPLFMTHRQSLQSKASTPFHSYSKIANTSIKQSSFFKTIESPFMKQKEFFKD